MPDKVRFANGLNTKVGGAATVESLLMQTAIKVTTTFVKTDVELPLTPKSTTPMQTVRRSLKMAINGITKDDGSPDYGQRSHFW